MCITIELFRSFVKQYHWYFSFWWNWTNCRWELYFCCDSTLPNFVFLDIYQYKPDPYPEVNLFRIFHQIFNENKNYLWKFQFDFLLKPEIYRNRIESPIDISNLNWITVFVQESVLIHSLWLCCLFDFCCSDSCQLLISNAFKIFVDDFPNSSKSFFYIFWNFI
jgi:hypothetical protein